MRNLFKAFAMVSVVSMLTRLMSFIFKIYLSRELGAEILGVYQIVFSILGLFSCLSSSGLPTTLSRITAETTARGDNKTQFSVFSTCIITSLIFAVGTCIIFYAFPHLVDLLFSDPRCVEIFMIVLPMLITVSLYCVIRGWFWGRKNYNVFATTELVDEFLKISFAIIFLSGGLFALSKDKTYAISMLISDIIMTVILIILYFVKGGRMARPRMFKSICKSSAPLTITRIEGSFMSTFMSLAIPAILIAKLGFSTSEATAAFGRASGMVMPLIFAPISAVGSLSVVLTPEIATLNANKNLHAFEKKLGAILKYTFVISGLFFCFYAGIGKPLGTMLYNDPLAGEYLQFAAILVFPMAANNILVSILNSLGKEMQTFFGHFTSCIFLVATVLLLSGVFGIKTYFIALAVFHTSNLIINMFLLSKKFHLESSLFFDVSFTCVVSFLIASIGKLSYNYLSLKTNTYVAFFICLIAFAALYISALSLLKIVNIKMLVISINERRHFKKSNRNLPKIKKNIAS